MVRFRLAGLTLLTTATLVLTSCQNTDTDSLPDARVTVHTTTEITDQAVAYAVAEYLTDQGLDATVETDFSWKNARLDAIGTLLSTDDDAVHLAVVNTLDIAASAGEPIKNHSAADLRSQTKGQLSELSEPVTVHSTTAADTAVVPVLTSITAERFAVTSLQDVTKPKTQDTPVLQSGQKPVEITTQICDNTHWHTGVLPTQWQDIITTEIFSDYTCEPQITTDPVTNLGTRDQQIDTIQTVPGTISMLYSVDPAITDHGFSTLAKSSTLLPAGNIVVVESEQHANNKKHQELGNRIDAVLQAANREELPRLIRYVTASQQSSGTQTGATNPPLASSPEQATRYWLESVNLISPSPQRSDG